MELNKLELEINGVPFPYDYSKVNIRDIEETESIRIKAYALVEKYLV